MKEHRNQEKAALQALRVAEKEAVAQTRATREYQVAIAKVVRASLRGRQGRAGSATRCASQAPESVDRHKVSEDVAGVQTRSPRAKEPRVFSHPHFHPPASQFGPYVYPNPFLHSLGAATLPPHFFFLSSSIIRPLSEFDAYPYSTVSTAQFSQMFPISLISTQAQHSWSGFSQGEGLKGDPPLKRSKQKSCCQVQR